MSIFCYLCLCIRGGRCRRRGSARWRRSWPSPWWCGSPGWAGAHTTPGGSWGSAQTTHHPPRTLCGQKQLIFKQAVGIWIWNIGLFYCASNKLTLCLDRIELWIFHMLYKLDKNLPCIISPENEAWITSVGRDRPKLVSPYKYVFFRKYKVWILENSKAQHGFMSWKYLIRYVKLFLFESLEYEN